MTTFVLSNSANLDLSPESQIRILLEEAKLRDIGHITLSSAVSCTAEGIFLVNCTSFKVCIRIGREEYIGAEGTCPEQQNFNPDIHQCDPYYVCTPCTREGFMCLTNTSFTLCSDALEVVVRNVTCPYNHCCNEAYRLPCMNQTLARCC